MRGLQYHGESFVKTRQDQSIVNMQPVMKTQVLKAISINFCSIEPIPRGFPQFHCLSHTDRRRECC